MGSNFKLTPNLVSVGEQDSQKDILSGLCGHSSKFDTFNYKWQVIDAFPSQNYQNIAIRHEQAKSTK